MKTIVLSTLCAVACFSHLAIAEEAKTEAHEGQAMHEEHCVSCHGSDVYTRENRQSTDFAKLRGRVQACNVNLGLNWFDEEVDTVTDYLNQSYYKYPAPAAE